MICNCHFQSRDDTCHVQFQGVAFNAVATSLFQNWQYKIAQVCSVGAFSSSWQGTFTVLYIFLCCDQRVNLAVTQHKPFI